MYAAISCCYARLPPAGPRGPLNRCLLAVGESVILAPLFHQRQRIANGFGSAKPNAVPCYIFRIDYNALW